MKVRFKRLAIALSLMALGAGNAIAAQYSTGANDTAIKIGNTVPYTGPASVYGQIGKIETLFFKMINDRGGVNGRKIEFLSSDDAYNPANTVKAVRRLVDQDHVFLMFSQVGTIQNLSVQGYLNREKIPQLLALSGDSKLNDPKNFPYTFPGTQSYYKEGEFYAKLILRQHPNEKIAVLYQNDDYGKDMLNGLMHGLGNQSKLVSTQSYEVSSPTVDSQMINLQHSGATVFVNIATPRAAAQAIQKIADLNWKPVQYLNLASTSRKLLASLGEDKTKGIQGLTIFKDPANPAFENDQDVKDYLVFMTKYAPDADPSDFFNQVGYAEGQALIAILQKAGDNLTRDNIKNIAANIDISVPLLLGKFHTTPTDYSPIALYQLATFDGHHWKLTGTAN